MLALHLVHHMVLPTVQLTATVGNAGRVYRPKPLGKTTSTICAIASLVFAKIMERSFSLSPLRMFAVLTFTFYTFTGLCKIVMAFRTRIQERNREFNNNPAEDPNQIFEEFLNNNHPQNRDNYFQNEEERQFQEQIYTADKRDNEEKNDKIKNEWKEYLQSEKLKNEYIDNELKKFLKTQPSNLELKTIKEEIKILETSRFSRIKISEHINLDLYPVLEEWKENLTQEKTYHLTDSNSVQENIKYYYEFITFNDKNTDFDVKITTAVYKSILILRRFFKASIEINSTSSVNESRDIFKNLINNNETYKALSFFVIRKYAPYFSDENKFEQYFKDNNELNDLGSLRLLELMGVIEKSEAGIEYNLKGAREHTCPLAFEHIDTYCSYDGFMIDGRFFTRTETKRMIDSREAKDKYKDPVTRRSFTDLEKKLISGNINKQQFVEFILSKRNPNSNYDFNFFRFVKKDLL
ncbi:MAG: hypothetical protein Tsb0021_01290 [Chlamydiales bacterium]